MKKVHFLAIFIIAVLTVGCSSESLKEKVMSGLKVTAMQTTPGVREKNSDVQVFSYWLVLTNYEGEEVFIESLEPVFGTDDTARLLDKDNKRIIRKKLKPNSSINVAGKIRFSLKGLAKEEDYNPKLDSFRITSEKIIGIKTK